MSDKQSVAGDSSFRKDNIAWFGDLPDGNRATVITRKNRFGQDEVINAYKNNPGYESELTSRFGTPAQSRTGNLGLEDQSVESATRGHLRNNTLDTSILHNTKSVAQNGEKVNSSIRSVSRRSNPYVERGLQQRGDLLDSLEGGNYPSSQRINSETGLPFSGSQAIKPNIAQNSENVNNGITRLVDLSYDVSKEVGSKAKKVAERAADIANERPFGGILRDINNTRTHDTEEAAQKLDALDVGKLPYSASLKE